MKSLYFVWLVVLLVAQSTALNRKKSSSYLGTSAHLLETTQQTRQKKQQLARSKTQTQTHTQTTTASIFLPPGGFSGKGTGCCQVCPQQFYDEISFLEVPLHVKQEAVRRFHQHHGLQNFVPVSSATSDSTVPGSGSFVEVTELGQTNVPLHLATAAAKEGRLTEPLPRFKSSAKASKSGGGGMLGGLANLAQGIVASVVGASNMGQRIEHGCCPLCTSTFMPPNDYMRQGSEPPGSAHAWGVSLLEKKNKASKDSMGAMGAAMGAMGGGAMGGGMPVSSGVTTGANDQSGRQRCCNVCMEQLYPPRDWSDVNAFLQMTSGTSTHKGTQTFLKKKRAIPLKFASFIELMTTSTSTTGFGGASQGLGPQSSGRSAPLNPPPCACRLCSETMSGLQGEENKFKPSTDQSPQGLSSAIPLNRPRNPMNNRMYEGGTPPGMGQVMGANPMNPGGFAGGMMGAKGRL